MNEKVLSGCKLADLIPFVFYCVGFRICMLDYIFYFFLKNCNNFSFSFFFVFFFVWFILSTSGVQDLKKFFFFHAMFHLDVESVIICNNNKFILFQNLFPGVCNELHKGVVPQKRDQSSSGLCSFKRACAFSGARDDSWSETSTSSIYCVCEQRRLWMCRLACALLVCFIW